MAENGNGTKRRMTLPSDVTAKDIATLRKITHEASILVDDDQNTRLQGFLATAEDTFAAPLAAEVHTPDQPRIYRLGDLLEQWDTFAEAAYDAAQGTSSPSAPLPGCPSCLRSHPAPCLLTCD